MKFIDFFAGIGGFRLGMEMAGHECVGHCEIDKYADKSYRAMHSVKESEWFANDITREEVSKIQEELCFLKSCGWLKSESLNIFSLKMSQDFFLTMGELLSEQSSALWGNWGMTQNGRCLTAKTLESPKTGKGCSLSDILEEQVDEKYFLSEKDLLLIQEKGQLIFGMMKD